MGKSIKKTSICFALALTLVFTMMPFAQTAEAADGDRSPAGAITMPTNRTLALKQGVDTKINFGTEYDDQNYYYFQIKPTKTGYITITSDYIEGNAVALCNANKELLSRGNKSSDDFYYSDSSYPYLAVLNYGVKAGKTYYIRVKGASTELTANDQPFVGSIKWTNSGVKGIGYGTLKNNAVSLQNNKAKSGVIIAGNTNHQWYKIKTSKKKVKISLSAKNNCGKFYARVYYKASGKWYSTKMTVERSADRYKNRFAITNNKKKTAKYYIEIYPKYKASGAYTLKVEAYGGTKSASKSKKKKASTKKTSVKAKNAKAHKAFKRVLKTMGDSQVTSYIYYRYVDMTGDKVDELLVTHDDISHAARTVINVYKYKKGKAVRVADLNEYGVNKLVMYKKTKAFIIACEGHGNKTCDYYKYSKKRGKFVRVASKGTYMNEYGNYGSWAYSGKNSAISKARFNAIVKKLKKGKRVNLWNLGRWRILGYAGG